MSFRWGEKQGVLNNRQKFLNGLGIRIEDCVAMSLEHGTDIIVVDSSFRGRGTLQPEEAPVADCCITGTKNVFLFLLTADCLPIIFYDSASGLTALAHMSRINTPMIFAEKILGSLREKGSRPENIIIGIGPGVRTKSYIFDHDELIKRTAGHTGWKDFLVRMPDGRTGIDLVGYNILQLVSGGVSKKNIEIAQMDTITDERFFSHYRSRVSGESEGRIATVVGFIK